MLLSVFLAFILWLYVIDVEDPEQSLVFTDVSVDITGENILQSQGLTVAELSDYTVDLKIRAPLSVLNALDNDSLTVTLDVSKLSAAGEFSADYTWVVPNYINASNVVLEVKTPTQITVDVEKLYAETFHIDWFLRGSIAEGYQAGPHTVSPETVTISGSVDAVSKVDRVVVILEQENMSDRFSGELPLVMLDSRGEVIQDETIDLSEQSAYVTVPIVMEKEIPLVVNYIAGAGATVDDISFVELSPETITVSGTEEDIMGLKEISLGSIDLSRVMDEKTFTFPIALDSSLNNVSGIAEATVTVGISGLATQTFEVTTIELINAPVGYKAASATEMRTVVVRGSEEDLAQIDPSQLRIVADLSDISASGSMTVPAKVFVDSVGDVGATGDYTIVVSITKS